MNLNISEHYEYNQYKEKLNEIFDKLDEVIYISNTIDYKKITILLAEIVQNFDYFKHHKDKLAADAAAAAAKAEAAKATMVGGVGNDDEEGVQEATSIPVEEQPPPKPYSKIYEDDGFAESIKNIKEGEEYIKLVSYINTTKQRINTKGTKLMEKVKEFITAYLQTPKPNTMIYSDYIKQHSNLEFKLNDIISNIEKIEEGIRKESTEYAKIYVNLMSNNWCSIKYEQFKFLAICADGWYSFIKKPFVKNAHVIEKDVITKDDYNDFVENKLYKLYNKLHDGFLKEPKDTKDSIDEKPSDTKATPTKDFDAINVLFKKQFESINKKLAKANAKADEAEDAKDEADVENDDVNEAEVANKGKAKEGESTNDEEGDEETKTETENKGKANVEEVAKEGDEGELAKPSAKPETEAKEETTPTTKEVPAKAETTPLTTKEAETKTTPTAKEKKAEAKIAKEAKALTEKAKALTEEAKANAAEAEARIIEARIESAKTLAEEKKASLASKAEENKALLEEKADNARKLVLQTRADAEAKMSSLIGNQTSQFKGLANSFNLLKGDVGAEAKKTKGFYDNIINKKNKLNPQNAFQEFTKI